MLDEVEYVENFGQFVEVEETHDCIEDFLTSNW